MIRLTYDDLFTTMPWNEIDTLVFDVGNVLLKFQPESILRQILPGEEELYPILLERVFHSPYWVMIDHGTASLEEIAAAMIGGRASLERPVRKIMKEWVEMKEQVPEGQRVLRRAAAMGKRLLVLSNYGDEPFAHVDEKYDFFRLFAGKVISSRVGLIKPDHEIYSRLAAEYHLTPERTLFIDDSPANIEGALHAGWQGICYNRPGKLDDFFGTAEA